MSFTTSRAAMALAAAAASVGAASLPAPALAQDGAAAADEIVVTARRREETLQDVPLSVSAFSSEQLELTGAQDITAIGQSTPNVTLEVSRGTNTTLTAFIRGVGQQDPVAGFEQGVGIYLDDVYLNRPQAAVLDIYDVERIELLRGPQGTLYGRNTIGGAVKYVTRRLAAEPAFSVRGAYGSYNQIDVVASGSLPLSETFRVSGAIASLNRDGFGTNLTTGQDNYDKKILAGRLSAEFEPSANFLIRLAGDVTQDDSSPRQGYRLIGTAADPRLSDRFDTRAGITNFGPLRDNEVQAYGWQATVEFKPSEAWTLKSITAYRGDETETPIDFDSTARRTFDVPAIYKNKQFSQELQAVFEGDRFAGVLGAYYLDANAFNGFDVIFSTISSFTLGDVDTETWAVFGEGTFDLTDTLSLTLGGRYTNDERVSRVVRQTFLGVPSPFFGNNAALSITAPVVVNGQQVVPTFNGAREDTDFTPRVILAWKPAEALNLYASFSEGFKGGGFDPRGNFANADVRAGFRPESVDSFEVGAKARLFDGRLLANTAVFVSDYTDVQIPGSVIVQTPTGTNFVGTVTNAGAAEFNGVEFEGTAFLTDALTANLSLGYIDAEYTEFIVNGVNIASQRAVQNTPEWTGSGGLSYAQPLGVFGREGMLTLTGSGAYRGASQQFENPIALLDQKEFWLFDASIVWTSENGGLRAGLHGKNLGDEDYITSGYNFPTVDNSVLAFYGNPRTVTATVEFRY
jgi:iron complex outermembrane receptor protein